MIHFASASLPAKPVRVRRCLQEAAIIMRSRGLAQFDREQRGSKRVCIHGAIGIAACGTPYATDSNPLYARSVRVVCHVLRERDSGVTGVTPNAAARWNNVRGRTTEEVAQLLELAARRVKVNPHARKD